MIDQFFSVDVAFGWIELECFWSMQNSVNKGPTVTKWSSLSGTLWGALGGFLWSGFSSGYSSFCHCCMGAKAFVWLDRMLHHRADPTNAMIGSDIARLDCHGEYRWSNWPRYEGTWFASPCTPDFLGKVGLNLALGQIKFFFVNKKLA